MTYKLEQIKLFELQNFIESEKYTNLENLPISYHRAVSYLHNPRAKKSDTVLFLLFDNKKLIAYRSLFSDKIIIENINENFAWISGSWVHPDYRRQGHSETILKEALLAWNDKLMFSNYAPESKSLYDKSGKFKQVFSKIGKRFYTRFCLAELLPAKHIFFKKTQKLIYISDILLNLFADFRFIFIRANLVSINFKIIETIDDKTAKFIEKHTKNNPFKRNKNEFLFIENYPWLIQKKQKDDFNKKYFFSSTSKQIIRKKIVLFDENNDILAFFIIKIRDSVLSVPYLYYENSEANNIAKIIISYIKKFKINYVTIFDKDIEQIISRKKGLFIFSKNIKKDFFASEKLSKILAFNKYKFQDGDGDSIFT